ncbi:dihydroneopterin triphosphate pyrophosphatase [Streptomyces sp. YIM 130001]|uniref:NUDIX domain-containing protein n=1 Tax=Streptomyces sp. YIM 130001 TaxID=2259644 RepID=UPI000E65BFD1|nr:NUDIX domain-containing protein [Streptomyces sp. YIM 130001]RII11930.1 dihydroneopterin triphosphate pyrophosphatase [Streptomyces sp. YIM 130001]
MVADDTAQPTPEPRTTYDGLPINPEPPYGSTVVVRTKSPDGTRYLLLHRAHEGPDFEGDWAWTPPAGARQPGEDVREGAVRELAEEAGPHLAALASTLRPLPSTQANWAQFLLDAPWGTPVELVDPEHDRWEWVPLAEGLRRCRPERVADSLRLAAEQP